MEKRNGNAHYKAIVPEKEYTDIERLLIRVLGEHLVNEDVWWFKLKEGYTPHIMSFEWICDGLDHNREYMRGKCLEIIRSGKAKTDPRFRFFKQE